MRQMFVLGMFAVVFGVSGCASFAPKAGANGEKLVFVKNIRFEGGGQPRFNNGGEIGGAIGAQQGGMGGAVAGGMLQGLVAMTVTAFQDRRAVVDFSDFDPAEFKGEFKWFPGGGGTIRRIPWAGVERLQIRTWAILSRDDQGDIVIPCETPCAPVN